MLTQNRPSSGLQDKLENLLSLAMIRAIDKAFADFIYAEESALAEPARECLAILAAFVSAQSGAQHSCIELKNLSQVFKGIYSFPAPRVIVEHLESAHTVANILNNADNFQQPPVKPLIVQNEKLYLHRYWRYEHELAAIISKKAAKSLKLDSLEARKLLATLFPNNPISTVDWQKIAVCIAASQSISFITGGPGTGKTTTVTKLLALLQGLAGKNDQVLNIQLVAPTGKAAARLTESITAAKYKLPLPLQANLPEQCQTIHRLLGAKPQSPYFKANARQPLHLDVLVLDEASMVDLPLMAKLLAALPNQVQVVLLGDHDQLASVETGSVLSDICAASHVKDNTSEHVLQGYSQTLLKQLGQLMPELASVETNIIKPSRIQDNVVRLVKSHRFGENSGIGQLAKQVKAGLVERCVNLLKEQGLTDINWFMPEQSSNQGVAQEILKNLIVKLLPLYKRYIDAVQQGELSKAFGYLQQQQVLCAQKTGYWGVTQLNALIENELHHQGLIDNKKDFYIGRPVMLAKNDHQLKLFNGDIGIVMADPDSPTLTKVWFITAEGEPRGLLPSRLPTLTTLYAMTIHKSQGSEFDSVHLCLPPINVNNQGRGLNRELIYTGLTRAKKQFSLYAQPKALSLSLNQQCIRGSGLAERLQS